MGDRMGKAYIIGYMRTCLTYFVLFFLMVSSAAWAEDDLFQRGYVPDELPPATMDQIDEALQVSIQCKATTWSRTNYDCDCTGMTFLDLRRKKGDKADPSTLLFEARKSCPNAVEVAGATLKQCETWAKESRPYDYKDFCGCFASEFSRQYEKNTTDNEMVRERQMTASYITCDQGKNLDERMDRHEAVRRLKKEGLFDYLFPGAQRSPQEKRE